MTTQNTPIQPAAKAPGLIKQVGFTLIELSIVLVIIGLIVGGVLVGQDLIKAAEIRATISQYEKYNAAINTFRTKYNAIPGDMLAADAGAFGLPCANATQTACTGATLVAGNGNGLITGNTNAGNQSGEAVLFWAQLSNANLIDGSLGSLITLTTGLATTAGPASFFPASKAGRGTYWTVGSASGLNYYMLATISATTADEAGATYTAGSGLSPIDAFNVDSKIDDGAPNTGTVQARGTGTTGTVLFADLNGGNTAPHQQTTPTSTTCITGQSTASSTSNTYSRGTTSGTGQNCPLRLRFN